MQRQLIVLRHAKSDWNTDAPNDHARPLNQRGRKDAPNVASRICELGWAPPVIVSSDAQRTRDTFDRMNDVFSEALGHEPDVHFMESLYHAGPYALEAALVSVPDSVQRVMAIGHNPGWEEVVYWLSGEATRMTTANAALLHVEADSWQAAISNAGSWTLEDVVRPKEL